MKPFAPHCVSATKASPSPEALLSAEAFGSMKTTEAAVAGMARPVVDTVVEVIVVVSLMMLPFTKTASIAKVVPITKMIPIAKVTEIIKIIVEVPEEHDRCNPHFKR